MARRVLSVGQCFPDQSTITAYLKRQFAAEVQVAGTADEAMSMLFAGPFDLVLVNRIFDEDGESGIEFVKAVKADPTTANVPVMLVSNYADAQQRAANAGAEPGFGKQQLGSDEVADRLRTFLAE